MDRTDRMIELLTEFLQEQREAINGVTRPRSMDFRVWFDVSVDSVSWEGIATKRPLDRLSRRTG